MKKNTLEMEILDPDEQVHGQEKPTTVSFELTIQNSSELWVAASPVAHASVMVGAVHGVAGVHRNLLGAALESTTSALVVSANWSRGAYQQPPSACIPPSPGSFFVCYALNTRNASNLSQQAQHEKTHGVSVLPVIDCPSLAVENSSEKILLQDLQYDYLHIRRYCSKLKKTRTGSGVAKDIRRLQN